MRTPALHLALVLVSCLSWAARATTLDAAG